MPIPGKGGGKRCPGKGVREKVSEKVSGLFSVKKGVRFIFRMDKNKPDTFLKSGTITAAGKLSADVPRGTLNVILKQAGLKH
jgi:hypothetical protein